MNKLIDRLKNVLKGNKDIDDNRREVKKVDADAIIRVAEGITNIEIINPKIIKGDLEERYNYYVNLDEKLKTIHCNSENIVQTIESNRDWMMTLSNLIGEQKGNKIVNEKILHIKSHIRKVNNQVEEIKEILKEGLKIRNNTIVGYGGEDELNKTLKFCDDILTSHQGCRFKVLEESNETDNLIVSPFGIFNVEVKNIGSQGKIIIHVEKDGRWNKYRVNSAGQKFRMEQSNVTAQVTRQSVLKQRLINEELKKKGFNDYVLVKPIIVIANDNVDIVNNTSDPIVRIPQLYSTITNNSRILSDEIINEINNIIKENTLPAIKYDFTDIDTLIFDCFYKIQDINRLIDSIV
ncbi:MAG: nuclease-related domain-containing protein [Clostridium sp.]